MYMLKGVFRYIVDRDYRFVYNAALGMYKKMPDDKYLKRMFNIKQGRDLDLDNPKTFNEKLQWLKLYDRKAIYTTMVDKYEAKRYVASIIGEEYIIPTLGVWDQVNDIDFDALPDQFVLKCTHDSHGLVICRDKDKLDIKSAKKKLKKGLSKNYYYHFREWPYKNVKPRIIAEKYLENSDVGSFPDYQFLCFDGLAKCHKTEFDRFVANFANYYDVQANLMKAGKIICSPNPEAVRPERLEHIRKLTDKLLKSNAFLHTEFYDIGGKIHLGELIFYHAPGFEEFTYDKNDELSGSWIELPGNLGMDGDVLICDDIIVVYRKTEKKVKRDTALIDYKIYTFNGTAKMCMINQDRGRHTRADYFDKNYNSLDFIWGYDHADVLPEKPKNYDLMFELAEKLSVGTIELRVDFYEVDEKVYFGELTFFDGSGLDKIEPIEWDNILGSWIQLPSEVRL